MPFWKEPTLPPKETMPRPRPPRQPAWVSRAFAGLAGAGLALAGMAGTARALAIGASRFGSFRALFLMVPAVFLWRYAVRGRLR